VPKFSKFSKFPTFPEVICTINCHLIYLTPKFNIGMPVSVLGHSKSAPEFLYICLACFFVAEHLYFIYTREQKCSSSAGKSQIALPKASAVPKASERSGLGMSSPCMRHAGKCRWRWFGPLAQDQPHQSRALCRPPPSCPPPHSRAPSPLRSSAQSATVFDCANHGDQLAKHLPNRA
jgi:hypothetical protein